MFNYLLAKRRSRVKGRCPVGAGHDELREVQVVVQNLAGVVEHSACALLYNLLQGHLLELGSNNQLVEVVNIRLQVLAVMETQRLVTDHGSQGLVW